MPAQDLLKPWLREFNQYLNSSDEVPSDMTLPRWWGVSFCLMLCSLLRTNIFLQLNSRRLPTWASLARDYLAIMGSSVSSERTFSSAGITITKRRNRLKDDIVEALQFRKAILRSELLFRELPSTILEQELDICDEDNDPEWVDEEDPSSWDEFVIDIDSDGDN
jgi:hypothetical protein